MIVYLDALRPGLLEEHIVGSFLGLVFRLYGLEFML